MKIWDRPETYLQDFYARAGNEGTTALGIFVVRSVPVQTKCASTCSSAGTALTDQYWVGIALYGSLV
jgi:hypothetical protein